MSTLLPITRTVAELRTTVAAWRSKGLSVGLVPTMGALHEGHLSLVRLARQRADRIVASLFVNPAQFAPNEDYGAYPRQHDDDARKLAAYDCDLLFAPDTKDMYPDGFATSVTVRGLSEGLCGASRPHFFGGVATIVAKLLNQCQPDIAVFGEKDYQQLLVIRRLVADLDLDVEIIGGPIVREADGLAMSSRNQYLSASQRKIAASLNRALKATAEQLNKGAPVSETLADAEARLLEAGFDRVDYLDVRAADDLAAQGPGPIERPSRAFGAAWLGDTRLIDNMAI